MKQKGQVAVGILVTAGIALMTATGAVFAWTYSTFGQVNDKISNQVAAVATVTQKTDDIDVRLTRIENKLDMLLSNQLK